MSERRSDGTLGTQFFAIIADPMVYRGMLYLLLAFPLGTFYFILLVTGFSLGIGLLIVWVGIPILVGLLLLARLLGAMERALANGLLGTHIRALPPVEAGTLWERLKRLLVSGMTWRSVAYLFVRFPLGIVAFVLLVTLLVAPVAMILTPLYYDLPGASIDIGIWPIDTLGGAVAVSLAGLILFFGALHAFKWTALAFGRVTRWMLSS